VIDYLMEIVGGPFDGVGGMRWHDDGEHPPPDLILVGVCRGDGSCNSALSSECAAKGQKHPYFWLPGEPTMPPKVVVYELSENFIEPDDGAMKRTPWRIGRAVYVIGGLLLPSASEARETVGVGVDGGELAPTGPVYAQASVGCKCRCVLIPMDEVSG
jgi:hypothetical protein